MLYIIYKSKSLVNCIELLHPFLSSICNNAALRIRENNKFDIVKGKIEEDSTKKLSEELR